jgi:hypothetical protein
VSHQFNISAGLVTGERSATKPPADPSERTRHHTDPLRRAAGFSALHGSRPKQTPYRTRLTIGLLDARSLLPHPAAFTSSDAATSALATPSQQQRSGEAEVELLPFAIALIDIRWARCRHGTERRRHRRRTILRPRGCRQRVAGHPSVHARLPAHTKAFLGTAHARAPERS